jgi:hypothetical protein
MKEYEVTLTVKQEDLEDILESAFGNSGIWYWANEIEIVSMDEDMRLSEALFKGKYLLIHDLEEDKDMAFTLKMLLDGLTLALKDGLDLSNIDGPAADSVVQYGLFGKQVYA